MQFYGIFRASIQGVPGGNVNILRGHSIGHSKQKSIYVLFRTVSEIELFHCTGVWIWRRILSFTPAIPRRVRFCLCGWMKCEAYRTKGDTRDELFDLIMDVVARIQERQDAFNRATRYVFTRAE